MTFKSKKPVTVGSVKTMEETQAKALLIACNRMGMRDGLLSEVRKMINSKIGQGVKFFSFPLKEDGGDLLSDKDSSKLASNLNLEFHKKNHTHRVRYSQEEKALLVVPVKFYYEVFKRRSHGE